MEHEPLATSLLPSQQQLVLRIQHLAGLDSNLVIVAGRDGAGKETLSSSIVEQYSGEFDLAWLPLTSKSTDSVIRSQILNQLFVDTVYDPDAPLQQNINDILGEQGGKQLIVLNHAERLSNQLLVELWSVVENSRKLPAGTHHISVLLFADPTWANRVAKEMAAITDADQPVLQIPPLPLDERKQLFNTLQNRLEQEPLDVDLFERQLDEQDGLPGEVVALCNNASMPQPAEVEPEHDEQAATKRNPIMLIASVVLLLFVALILVWAFSNDHAPTSTATSESQQLNSDSAEQADVSDNSHSTEPVPNAAEQVAKQQLPQESLPQQLPTATFTAQVDDESDKQRVELDEQTLDQIATKVPEQSTVQVEAETEIQPTEVDQPISQPPAPAQVEAVEQPAQPEQKEPVQQAPATPATTEPQQVAPWWQHFAAQHYVLQLGVMSSEAGLEKFAKRYGLSSDVRFRHYQTSRNGKQVYIGVYGNYPTAAAARNAIKSMAPAVQKLSPWPKPVAKIQQEAQRP